MADIPRKASQHLNKLKYFRSLQIQQTLAFSQFPNFASMFSFSNFQFFTEKSPASKLNEKLLQYHRKQICLPTSLHKFFLRKHLSETSSSFRSAGTIETLLWVFDRTIFKIAWIRISNQLSWYWGTTEGFTKTMKAVFMMGTRAVLLTNFELAFAFCKGKIYFESVK